MFIAAIVCVLLAVTSHCVESAGNGDRAMVPNLTAADLQSETAPANGVWLESLDISLMNQQWGYARARKSVDGNPLKIGGTVYPHGVGTHAISKLKVELNGCAQRFAAMVGVDDEVGSAGSVIFQIFVDGKLAADSGLMRGDDPAKLLSVDLSNAKIMELVIRGGDDGIDFDHADWAGAVFVLAPGAEFAPKAWILPDEPPMPIASGNSDRPSINGPRVVGAAPGNPFLLLIPATGKAPLKFSAKNLPKSLKLDSNTGIISGSLKRDGTTVVDLTVSNSLGSATRKLSIVGGKHKLSRTPPMGWNSWNVWGCSVDDKKVRDAIDMMVNSGLAAHGYQYVNIDDAWEGERGEDGSIKCNDKFPDMKALADYAHSKGLKLGIYSSPGLRTCAGYEGSYQHEEQDAKTWAEWGIDYIKYDWCSYGSISKGDSLVEFQKPYRVMREALDKCGRDIVFSLCQYGMGEVWKWGEEVGGDLWRTTGDITDNWYSMSGIGFDHDDKSSYAGPGHWNDPDMLVVGKVGWGPNLRRTRLTPNEQITHATLWSLLAAPMLIGCDLSQLDQFTIDLLCNDEVIAVDQDPLGIAARRKAVDGELEVWARPLFDKTIAVGLFNRSDKEAAVTAKWSDLGLKGIQPVRDLWQRKNMGNFKDSFSGTIKAHGTMLIKIGESSE